MNYEQALEYIYSMRTYTTKPGLRRIQNLLKELGSPEKRMRYVHIAGTNGKGSSTAMTASVLEAAGYKTGSFISPFLERFNERMQVSGEPIPDDRLAELTEQVKGAVERVTGRGLPHLTFFELLTAMSFEYWAQERCDFVSLEVGMGGRLDATNVIDPPEVAMIGPISRDHTHYLGESLTEIAYEKCGVIKHGCKVVCYAEQAEEAKRVIEAVCRERGAEFIQPDASKVEILGESIEGSRFRYDGLEVNLPLVGRHQVMNAIGVIEAMRALRASGYHVSEEDIVRGLEQTKWVGRLEIVRREPLTIIDAAHNPDAVRVLGESVDKLLAGRRIVAVMGILADKDYAYCIPEIARRADAFVACTPSSGRALEASDCAEVARVHCANVEVVADIREAVERGIALAGKDDVVLVCGSLYVIGEAKTHLRTL